jgi:Caspase domain
MLKIIRNFSFWVVICAAGPAASLASETHALLIGVSGYPNLSERSRLNGPINDVTIFSDAINKLGVSKIRILADGHPNSVGLPTRLIIMQEIRKLVQQAKPNDWVIVYFAGHGSQQPQRAASISSGAYREPDRLNEILLPYDHGKWDQSLFGVTNAIVDDELGRHFNQMLEKQLAVWAIFDTCHAGDLIKSPFGKEQKLRRVMSAELGLPAISNSGATKKKAFVMPNNNKSVAATPGMVAFYAAQSDESAPEELLEIAGLSRKYGVFTHALVSEINKNQAKTFSELMSATTARYKQERRPFPSPSLDGSGNQKLPWVK